MNRYLVHAMFLIMSTSLPLDSWSIQTATKTMPLASSSQASLPPPTAITSVPCNTIDDGTDDDGFLACMRGALYKVSTPNTPLHPEETNLAQAVRNLEICSRPQRTNGMIVGHGRPGFVHVGDGNVFLDEFMFIADLGNVSPNDPWNRKSWTKILQDISIANRFDSIILFGCETGSGSGGALLLNDLSALTKSKILAPTSLVQCNKVTGEFGLLGGEFNEAKPGSPAQVKPKPKISRRDAVPKSKEIKIALDETDKYKKIPLSSIKSIWICQFPSPAHPQGGKKRCFDASRHQKWLTSNVFFGSPFHPPYIIGADVTGYIEIIFGEGREGKLHLNILNDELLNDPEAHTYYYVTETFEQSWTDLK